MIAVVRCFLHVVPHLTKRCFIVSPRAATLGLISPLKVQFALMNYPAGLMNAELSEYINNPLVQIFEKLTLEDEASSIRQTDDHSPLLDKSQKLLSASRVPRTLRTLPSSERHQPEAAGQSSHFPSIEPGWVINNSALSSRTHISRFQSLQNSVVLARSRKGRLNIKRNLTAAEIGPVASGLITNDSIPFFLNNFQLIFDIWISFLTTKTSARSANHAVVAAFDVLYDLATDDRDTRFLLRFAYVQLVEAIDALVKVASADRLAGHVHGGVGFKDESVYIDVYLTAKGKPLNNPKLRNELSGHKRIGRRFREITNLSLLLLAVYSDNAESVVQNTSIDLPTLGKLVTKVEQTNPDLVCLLVDLAQKGELAIKSGTALNIRHLRDAIEYTRIKLLELVSKYSILQN